MAASSSSTESRCPPPTTPRSAHRRAVVNAARHQVGGPSTVRLLARHRVCADGHVGVHEDATGAERQVNAFIEREFAYHGGNVVQGEGRGHGVTRGERRLERPLADTSAGPKSLEPKAAAWASISGSMSMASTAPTRSWSSIASAKAPVPAPRSSTRVGRTPAISLAALGQAFFVAWDKRADGLVVGSNLKAKMMADGVAHQLIVGRWFIDAHVQSFRQR